MQARDQELETICRSIQAALGRLAAPVDQREANVFRLASMLLRPRFPVESGTLMAVCDRYFSTHPADLIESAQIVRNGWVISLPRLRDLLERGLLLRKGAGTKIPPQDPSQ